MNNEDVKVPCRVCTKCGQVIEANGVELTHYGCNLMNIDKYGKPIGSTYTAFDDVKPQDTWTYKLGQKEAWEEARKKFVTRFCNDHNGEIRWLRSIAFDFDNDDLLKQIIELFDSKLKEL